MLSRPRHSLGVVPCEPRAIPDPRRTSPLSPRAEALPAGLRPSLQRRLDLLLSLAPTDLQQHSATLSRDYVEVHPATRPLRKTAKGKSRSSIMCHSTSPPTSPPRLSQAVHFPIRLHKTSNATFTLRTEPEPNMAALTFLPRPAPLRPRKRCRAVTDIDGEHSCLHKKKRRLRLFLITSRLSPEFSHPATNIVDRGSSKIAVWAKQKALGRNLLRKAAILNQYRRQAMSAEEVSQGRGDPLVEQEREQEQLEMAKWQFVHGSHDIPTCPVVRKSPSAPSSRAGKCSGSFDSPSLCYSSPNLSSALTTSTRSTTAEDSTYHSPNEAYAYPSTSGPAPRRSYIPLPPSPLGISNYDAFDVEEDIPDPYSHLDDDDSSDEMIEGLSNAYHRAASADATGPSTSTLSTAVARPSPLQMIYSDFNILDPGEPVIGDYDQIDDGADAVWPATSNPDATQRPVLPASDDAPGSVSRSPNFAVLLATEKPTVRRIVPVTNHGPASLVLAPMSERWTGSPATDRHETKEEDFQQERERQRRLMFLPFDS